MSPSLGNATAHDGVPSSAVLDSAARMHSPGGRQQGSCVVAMPDGPLRGTTPALAVVSDASPSGACPLAAVESCAPVSSACPAPSAREVALELAQVHPSGLVAAASSAPSSSTARGRTATTQPCDNSGASAVAPAGFAGSRGLRVASSSCADMTDAPSRREHVVAAPITAWDAPCGCLRSELERTLAPDGGETAMARAEALLRSHAAALAVMQRDTQRALGELRLSRGDSSIPNETTSLIKDDDGSPGSGSAGI